MPILFAILVACRTEFSPDQPTKEDVGEDRILSAKTMSGVPEFLQLPLNEIATSNAACLSVRWGTGPIERNAMFLSASTSGTVWYRNDGRFAFEYYGGRDKILWDGETLWENSIRWEAPIASSSEELNLIPLALQFISNGFGGGIWTVENSPFAGHQGVDQQWAKLKVPGIEGALYFGVKQKEVFSVISVDGDWYGVLNLSYSDWDYSPTTEQLSVVPSGERWARCTIQNGPVEEL